MNDENHLKVTSVLEYKDHWKGLKNSPLCYFSGSLDKKHLTTKGLERILTNWINLIKPKETLTMKAFCL